MVFVTLIISLLQITRLEPSLYIYLLRKQVTGFVEPVIYAKTLRCHQNNVIFYVIKYSFRIFTAL